MDKYINSFENEIKNYLSKKDEKHLFVVPKSFFLDDTFSFSDKHNNEFLTYDELLTVLIDDNRILLKEEKEIFFFYNALTKEQKNFFNISNYYDVVDIYPQFKEFITSIYENNLDKDKLELNENQNKIAKIYFEIDSTLSNDSKYCISYMRYKQKLKNLSFLDKYEKIYFLNPFYKKNIYLKITSEITKEYTNLIEANEQIYDSKNVRLIGNEVNKLDKAKLNLVKVLNNMSSIIYVANNKVENIYIYDEAIKNEMPVEYNIFNGTSIAINQKYTLDKFPEYKVLEYMLEVLETMNNNKFNVDALYKAINYDVIKNMYKINKEDIKPIYKKYIDNIFYLNLSETKEKVQEFLNQILEIKGYTKISDFQNLIEKIINSKKPSLYKNFDSSHYILEAYTELLALETFDFAKDLNKYFDNLGVSILIFILKYFKYKKVKQNVKNMAYKEYILISDKKDKLENKNLFHLNFEGIPETKNLNLLTLKQQEKLNINLDEDKFNIFAFDFCKQVNKVDTLTITYVENLEINKFEPSFISYLKYELNIKENNFEISSQEYVDIFKTEYNEEKSDRIKTKLKVKNSDYRPDKIGYYDMEKISKSPYVFYVASLLKRSGNLYKDNISYSLVLGNIIHESAQKCLLENITDKNKFLEILKELFLVKYSNNFFNSEVFYNIYNDSIYEFYLKIYNALYSDQKSWEVEKSIKKGNYSIKIDFYQDSDDQIDIIDLKTQIKFDDKTKNIFQFKQLYLYATLIDEVKNKKTLLTIFEFKDNQLISKRLDDENMKNIIDYVEQEKLEVEKYMNYKNEYYEIESDLKDNKLSENSFYGIDKIVKEIGEA